MTIRNRICAFAVIVILGAANVMAADNSSLSSILASYEQVEDNRVFDGVVESKYQSTMSSQTSGQVIEIRVDVNDVVLEGEVVLRIDDTVHQAKLLEAKANLKLAVVLQQEAKDEFERISNLSIKQLVSQSELNRARTQLDVSQARYDQIQAQLTLAKKQLDYTVVKAPYSGVVVARHVQIGESVQVDQPLLTGFSLADLRVVTAIPSEMVSHVRMQGAVVISALGTEDKTVVGDKITVFPYADNRTHSFKVRIDLPANTTKLYPGNFVKAAFIVSQQPRLLIPDTAVAKRSEVKGVYVIDPNDEKLSFRYVVTGKPYGSKVEILSGLSEGERVVLDPTAAAVSLKMMVR